MYFPQMNESEVLTKVDLNKTKPLPVVGHEGRARLTKLLLATFLQ